MSSAGSSATARPVVSVGASSQKTARRPVASEQPKIGLIFSSGNRHISEQYLCEAFDPAELVRFDLDLYKSNVSIFRLLDCVASQDGCPSFVVHYIGATGLPRDLHRAPVPTVGLNIDGFSWTSSRLRWAMLFDHVLVWQPSLVESFRKAGHPSVLLLPHAADHRLFDTKERDRRFELGWVGRGFGVPWYKRRDRVIRALAAKFRMNDWRLSYSKQETAEIYQQSKIVVNVSRDEFPQEANMRCYEAMAGGALLITGLPTELSELGFCEGEHFIGWSDEREIPDLVSSFLSDERKRRDISQAGQQFVLAHHTYQQRREQLLAFLEEQGGKLCAPARRWPLEDVQLVYLEYYYRHLLLLALLEEFQALRKTNRRTAWKGMPMVLKALRHILKRTFALGG